MGSVVQDENVRAKVDQISFDSQPDAGDGERYGLVQVSFHRFSGSTSFATAIRTWTWRSLTAAISFTFVLLSSAAAFAARFIASGFVLASRLAFAPGFVLTSRFVLASRMVFTLGFVLASGLIFAPGLIFVLVAAFVVVLFRDADVFDVEDRNANELAVDDQQHIVRRDLGEEAIQLLMTPAIDLNVLMPQTGQQGLKARGADVTFVDAVSARSACASAASSGFSSAVPSASGAFGDALDVGSVDIHHYTVGVDDQIVAGNRYEYAGYTVMPAAIYANAASDQVTGMQNVCVGSRVGLRRLVTGLRLETMKHRIILLPYWGESKA